MKIIDVLLQSHGLADIAVLEAKPEETLAAILSKIDLPGEKEGDFCRFRRSHRQGDKERRKQREEKRSTGVSLSPCPFVSLSRSLLCLDDRSAGVITAIRTNYVRWLHRAAFRAGLKLLRCKSMMRTPHASARVRLFAFRNAHCDTYDNDSNQLYFGLISVL